MFEHLPASVRTHGRRCGALAFAAALVAIGFLMASLKRVYFGIFALYRVIAGAGILYWYYGPRGA